VEGESNRRLINLTKSVGGDVYLSGDGADDYQLAVMFDDAGIELRKLGFRPQPYAGRSGVDFVPGLSILDPLCFIGAERTRALLKG